MCTAYSQAGNRGSRLRNLRPTAPATAESTVFLRRLPVRRDGLHSSAVGRVCTSAPPWAFDRACGPLRTASPTSAGSEARPTAVVHPTARAVRASLGSHLVLCASLVAGPTCQGQETVPEIGFHRQTVLIPTSVQAWQAWPDWLFADLDQDKLDDLVVVCPLEHRIHIYRQKATGFPEKPDQSLEIPPETAWIGPCDVDVRPELELVLAIPTGVLYWRQNGGVCSNRRPSRSSRAHKCSPTYWPRSCDRLPHLNRRPRGPRVEPTCLEAGPTARFPSSPLITPCYMNGTTPSSGVQA